MKRETASEAWTETARTTTSRRALPRPLRPGRRQTASHSTDDRAHEGAPGRVRDRGGRPPVQRLNDGEADRPGEALSHGRARPGESPDSMAPLAKEQAKVDLGKRQARPRARTRWPGRWRCLSDGEGDAGVVGRRRRAGVRCYDSSRIARAASIRLTAARSASRASPISRRDSARSSSVYAPRPWASSTREDRACRDSCSRS